VISRPASAQQCAADPVTPPELAAVDYFGSSVAIDGDWAIVGAVTADVFDFGNSGAAYFYQRSLLGGEPWIKTQQIVAQFPQSNGEFGMSVAISGAAAVVGAPGHYVKEGTAFVYRRQPPATQFSFEAELRPSDGAWFDHFGGLSETPWLNQGVAISGDVVVVGASGKDYGEYLAAGAAYIFRYTATPAPSWTEEAVVTAPLPQNGAGFGSSVAINGQRVVITAPAEDLVEINQGAVYVYRYDSNLSAWLFQQELVAANPQEGDLFGDSIAIDGSTMLIGAPGRDAAFFFRLSGSTWVQQQMVSGNASSKFGDTVSLSGSLAVVGAWLEIEEAGQVGAAYVYQRIFGVSPWALALELISSHPDNQDMFGFAVAIDGDDAFIGSIGDAAAGYEKAGSVAVYGELPDCP
jgi:hypothetical protein